MDTRGHVSLDCTWIVRFMCTPSSSRVLFRRVASCFPTEFLFFHRFFASSHYRAPAPSRDHGLLDYRVDARAKTTASKRTPTPGTDPRMPRAQRRCKRTAFLSCPAFFFWAGYCGMIQHGKYACTRTPLVYFTCFVACKKSSAHRLLGACVR